MTVPAPHVARPIRKMSTVKVPVLARALAQRKTVFTNKNVHVSYRDPEFFSGSPISILETWLDSKGKQDEMVNPDAVSAQIASGAFSLSLSSSKIQEVFGVKVSISGNTNINTAARVDASLTAKSLNEVNQVVKAQLNLKSFSVDFFHFFAKAISQVVDPMVVEQAQRYLKVTSIDPTASSAITIGFQQLATYSGTGPDGLTVQIEPLSSRHPDVLSLAKNLGRVRRFLAMVEKKYRYLCDMTEEISDWDDVDFLAQDVEAYDLD